MEITILKIETTDLIKTTKNNRTIYPHILLVYFYTFESTDWEDYLNHKKQPKVKCYYINDNKRISKSAYRHNGLKLTYKEFAKAKPIKKRINSINREIARHKIILGHNIKDFDIPILTHFGAKISNKHIVIDTLEILKKLNSNFLTLLSIYKYCRFNSDTKFLSLGERVETILYTFFNSIEISKTEFDWMY